MKETIILLYFLQTDYGRRLLRFLTRKKNKQIRLELMTERERVMWRTETENQRIVVLTDDEGLYAEAKKEVVLLGKADDRQQLIECEIDLSKAGKLRESKPYLSTRRPECYL